MEHYPAVWNRVKRWREALEKVVPAGDPWATTEMAHAVVHNAVVAMRNHRSQESGKVRHEEVRDLAVRAGFPRALADRVGFIEAVHAPLFYGVRDVGREQAEDYLETARETFEFARGAVEKKRKKK